MICQYFLIFSLRRFTSNKFVLGTTTDLNNDCSSTDYIFVPGSTISKSDGTDATFPSDKYCGVETDVPINSVITCKFLEKSNNFLIIIYKYVTVLATTPGPLYIRFKSDNVLSATDAEQGFSWSYREKTGNTCQ